jgi:hypothetical protein
MRLIQYSDVLGLPTVVAIAVSSTRGKLKQLEATDTRQ